MEQFIREKQRVNEYATLMGISRITLNQAAKAQFNTTATHLLRQRLLFEIQDLLIHSDHSVNQIAFDLNFSEPNHLMRFFKTQTGKTIGAFIQEFKK
jgi:AraC family transcriptional activator of pobA